MATTTARYRFEYRMFDWAESFTRSLCGARRSFFIGLRTDGSIRRAYFAREGQTFDGERKTALVESHPVWILFSPYDEAGSGYLEWFNLNQAVAERWLQRGLETADFIDVRSNGNRDGWPSSWRVIVG
jgi:hypothetical protein